MGKEIDLGRERGRKSKNREIFTKFTGDSQRIGDLFPGYARECAFSKEAGQTKDRRK
jgi:hypothetical protein